MRRDRCFCRRDAVPEFHLGTLPDVDSSVALSRLWVARKRYLSLTVQFLSEFKTILYLIRKRMEIVRESWGKDTLLTS